MMKKSKNYEFDFLSS